MSVCNVYALLCFTWFGLVWLCAAVENSVRQMESQNAPATELHQHFKMASLHTRCFPVCSIACFVHICLPFCLFFHFFVRSLNFRMPLMRIHWNPLQKDSIWCAQAHVQCTLYVKKRITVIWWFRPLYNCLLTISLSLSCNFKHVLFYYKLGKKRQTFYTIFVILFKSYANRSPFPLLLLPWLPCESMQKGYRL